MVANDFKAKAKTSPTQKVSFDFERLKSLAQGSEYEGLENSMKGLKRFERDKVSYKQASCEKLMAKHPEVRGR